MSPMQTFVLPTVSFPSNTGMDFFAGPSPDNYNEVRGRPLSTKGNISRDLSMSSTKSSVAYHERMECNNAMVVDEKMDDISPALSYEEEQEKALRVSKVAEQQDNMRFKGGNLNASKLTPQCVLNKEQHSYPTCGSTTHIKDDNVINIQCQEQRKWT